MRRAPAIDLRPILATAARPAELDDVAARILDTAAELLVSHGLRRCSVEEIAERSGVGRTTVYRRFDNKDEIIHAVLVRECRRFFAAIAAAVDHCRSLEDRVVEGFLAGLRAVRASSVSDLLRSEPDLMRYVTTDAGPVLSAATAFLVAEYRRIGWRGDAEVLAGGAELLVRLAMSFVVTPDSVLPFDDDDKARAALHCHLDPLLRVGRR